MALNALRLCALNLNVGTKKLKSPWNCNLKNIVKLRLLKPELQVYVWVLWSKCYSDTNAQTTVGHGSGRVGSVKSDPCPTLPITFWPFTGASLLLEYFWKTVPPYSDRMNGKQYIQISSSTVNTQSTDTANNDSCFDAAPLIFCRPPMLQHS